MHAHTHCFDRQCIFLRTALSADQHPLQAYTACLPLSCVLLQWWGNLEHHHKKTTMCINRWHFVFLSLAIAQMWSWQLFLHKSFLGLPPSTWESLW